MTEDPYEVLGVSRDATPDEIKSAYRKKARENHPDLNPNDPNAAERMNRINEAYDRICNPEKYAAVDRQAQRNANARSAAGGYGGYGSYGGSSQGSSSGYSQRNTGGGYSNQNGPYGWQDGFDFDDLFGFGMGSQRRAAPIHPEVHANDSPTVRQAISYINAKRFDEALQLLETVTSDGRDARWYYLAAIAAKGAGNELSALENIRKAVRLDPNNKDYQDVQRQYQQTGNQYQQQGQSRGFSYGVGGGAGALCLALICCGPQLCRMCGYSILCC